MDARSRTLLAAFAVALLAGAVAFAVSRLDGLSRLPGRTPEESKPTEESKPVPSAPHVPAAIGPEGEGPITSRPSYAPDGREVAFWTLWRGAQPDIWVVSTLNGRLRPLATDPDVGESEPAWSPNGSAVAFKSDRAGNLNIWLARPDGSNLTQLTTGRATDDQPAWSPDGTQIAFVSDRAGTRNIWVINADGSGLRRVTNAPGNQNHPSFSPDGSRIVLSQGVYSKVGAGSLYVGSNLWIVNANGTGLRQLTTVGFNDSSPSWGAQGILFQSNRIQADGTRSHAIWMVQPDGSGLRVFPNALGLNPRWSPDGTKFAFGDGDGINEFNLLNSTIRWLVQLKGYFIAIDIIPGVAPNVIRLKTDPKEMAPIRVAILSAPGFKPVQEINQASISFGPTGDERSLSFCTADEVNGDGVPDLVCHFEIQPTGFRAGHTEGILRVMTVDRIRLEGRGAVQIVP